MVKKIVAILLIMCIACGMLTACKAEKITAEEAYQIVVEELDALAQGAEKAHIHTGTYEGKPCYNVYVTVAGHTVVYVISETGKVLHTGPEEHGH